MRRAPIFFVLMSAALLTSGCISTVGLERSPSPSPSITEAGVDDSPFVALKIVDPDYEVPAKVAGEVARSLSQGGENSAYRLNMSQGEADRGRYTLRYDCTPAEASVTFKATGSSSGMVARAEGCESPGEVTGLTFDTAAEAVSVEIQSNDDTVAGAWATLVAEAP